MYQTPFDWRITDIKKNNDHYFALDKRNECIYIFNKDWKYSGTLSRQNGGPRNIMRYSISTFTKMKLSLMIYGKSYTTKSVT